MSNKHFNPFLTFFITINILITISCTQSPPDNKEFTNNLVDGLRSHHSVNYKIKAKKYRSNSLDTSVTSYEIWIVRKQGHRKRSGFVRVDNHYRPTTKVFDNGTLWKTNSTQNTTIQTTNFRGLFIATCDYIDLFLNPDEFTNQIANPNNHIIISDTLYQENNCKNITIEFPINDYGIETSLQYIINTENYTPLWAHVTKKEEHQTRITELSFSNLAFDKLDIKTMRKMHGDLLEANPVKENLSNTRYSILSNMLMLEDNAPRFNGQFYPNNKAFSLQDYIGKNIIILDFWFTHCPPCINSIPALNEVYDQYRDKGIKIFGINSIDNKSQNLDYLKTFTDRHTIDYDVILVDSKVDFMYKIQRYPTVYLIDLDGTISFIDFGYHSNSVDGLTARIKELL